MATEELVTEQFQFLGINADKEVITKCVRLCEEYDIDAETFTEQWMAFSLNHLNGVAPDLVNLDLLARKEFSKRSTSNAAHNDSANRSRSNAGAGIMVYGAPASVSPELLGTKPIHVKNIMLINYKRDFNLTTVFTESSYFLNIRPEIDVLSNYMTGTPKRIKKEPVASNQSELRPATYSPTVGHSDKYASRTNPGSVVHSFGEDGLLQVIAKPNGPNDIIDINITQVPNDEGDLYNKSMIGFELLHEKASTFDNHIRYISQCIMKNVGIRESTSVRHKTQTEVCVVGRIECDADARLNPKCVVLQGTWEESLSQAVPVDLDGVKQYSLFPGQVVVMRGNNPRGNEFVASEVYHDASQTVPDHSADLVNSYNGTMSMVVASGPYTTSDNLAYEPLKDLLSYVSSNKPHVVIMTGPFLDSEHSKVKDNTMAETYKAFFDKLVDSFGELSSSCPFTKIYIVSSVKDAFHVNIYPTPAYSSRRKQPNIVFVPDPTTLNIGGVIVGVTSTDVLMHISQEEISLGCGGDKLARLASHVLSQQCYYPLCGVGGLGVDAALWAAHAQLPSTPHVLVLPSNFRYFIKEVNGTVVVNPEHLTKGTSGGTFARLLISTTTDSKKIAAQIVRI